MPDSFAPHLPDSVTPSQSFFGVSAIEITRNTLFVSIVSYISSILQRPVDFEVASRPVLLAGSPGQQNFPSSFPAGYDFSEIERAVGEIAEHMMLLDLSGNLTWKLSHLADGMGEYLKQEDATPYCPGVYEAVLTAIRQEGETPA